VNAVQKLQHDQHQRVIALQNRLKAIEQERDSMQMQLDAVTNELTATQSENLSLQQNLTSKDEQNGTQERHICQLQEELLSKQASAQILQQELTDAMAKLKEVEEELRQVKYLQGLQTDKLSSQLTSRDQELTTAKTQMMMLQEQLTATSAALVAQQQHQQQQQQQQTSVGGLHDDVVAPLRQEGSEDIPSTDDKASLLATIQHLRARESLLTSQLEQQRKATQQTLTIIAAEKRDRHLFGLQMRHLREELNTAYKIIDGMKMHNPHTTTTQSPPASCISTMP